MENRNLQNSQLKKEDYAPIVQFFYAHSYYFSHHLPKLSNALIIRGKYKAPNEFLQTIFDYLQRRSVPMNVLREFIKSLADLEKGKFFRITRFMVVCRELSLELAALLKQDSNFMKDQMKEIDNWYLVEAMTRSNRAITDKLIERRNEDIQPKLDIVFHPLKKKVLTEIYPSNNQDEQKETIETKKQFVFEFLYLNAEFFSASLKHTPSASGTKHSTWEKTMTQFSNELRLVELMQKIDTTTETLLDLEAFKIAFIKIIQDPMAIRAFLNKDENIAIVDALAKFFQNRETQNSINDWYNTHFDEQVVCQKRWTKLLEPSQQLAKLGYSNDEAEKENLPIRTLGKRKVSFTLFDPKGNQENFPPFKKPNKQDLQIKEEPIETRPKPTTQGGPTSLEETHEQAVWKLKENELKKELTEVITTLLGDGDNIDNCTSLTQCILHYLESGKKPTQEVNQNFSLAHLMTYRTYRNVSVNNSIIKQEPHHSNSVHSGFKKPSSRRGYVNTVVKSVFDRDTEFGSEFPYDVNYFVDMSNGTSEIDLNKQVIDLAFHTQASCPLDALPARLKKLAEAHPEKVSFGLIALYPCDSFNNDKGHALVYYTKAKWNKVLFIDAQQEKPFFTNLNSTFDFVGTTNNKNSENKPFGNIVFYTPMGPKVPKLRNNFISNETIQNPTSGPNENRGNHTPYRSNKM